jgi:integrase
MNNKIEDIAGNYTLSELEKLISFLSKIEDRKKAELESSLNIFKFSKEYQTYIKNTFSEKYLSSVLSSMKHLMQFFGEEKNIRLLNIKDAESFKIYLMDKAPRGFRTYLRTIKAMFNKAKEWEYISLNPFSKLKFRKRQALKPSFIGKTELNKILIETNNSTIRDIFIIAFNTGLRLSEITNLKWSNINLVKDIITVGDEEFTTKNSKQRLIPIANEVKILLLKIKKKSYIKNGFIFSKPNGFCYNSDYVSSSFKKACRRANIKENIHFHSLRHSFASNLANKGVPLIAIKELLGHSDISTTQIYSHTNLENLQNAIQKLNAA